MEKLLESTISELKLETSSLNYSFTPKVIHFLKSSFSHNNDTPDRVFILDSKACQIHVLSSDDDFNKKTFFLTPQPSSYPKSILVSPDQNFLAVLTETSVHVVDISRLDSLLRSKQTKIIAKLSTAYDSLSGETVNVCRLVRVRWHPYTPNILVFLTSNGKLQFCRFACSSGGSFKFEDELVVNLDVSAENPDKENCLVNSFGGLNLSEAMGTVYTDFDFGSPFFFNETRFAQDTLLRVPVYTICENGDIQLVSASPVDINQPLVRVVRILPANEDYYTFDFETLVCLRGEEGENQPDVICFANRAGRVFHGVCLHIPPSVLLQSSSRPQGRSVPVLYLIDSVDLELPIMDKSLDTSARRSEDDSDNDSELDSSNDSGLKLFLLPATYVWSNTTGLPPQDLANSYFCLHYFGIHYVSIPWMASLHELYSSFLQDENSGPDLVAKFRSKMSFVEYLLLTQNLNSQTSGLKSKDRAMIGLLPGKIPPITEDTVDLNITRAPALNIVFGSSPIVVTVPLPSLSNPEFSVSLSPIHDVVKQDPSSEGRSDKSRNAIQEKTTPTRPAESDFVKNCRRNLKTAKSLRLPIMSSHEDNDNISELEFIRLFLKATESLRTTQMNQYSGLTSSVLRHAQGVEGALAAQSEEVAALADARNDLHTCATRLTDRHALIIERQEALNHRISELARRIFSTDAGLTDAEVDMRDTVQTLRDRLKSGLLGWLENIRLQYDHLTTRLKQQQRATSAFAISTNSGSAINPWGGDRSVRNQQITTLPSSQTHNLISALKAEGSEIDALVKAVEKINLMSKFATPPFNQSTLSFSS
nr:nuclear pore complex protein nup88 [Hymenolepis microstoma]